MTNTDGDNDFLRNPAPGPAHDDGKQTPPTTEQGDDIPDTPPTEPQPAPVQDPRPPGQPRGPYVV
jgi:hypothetical protein